MKDRFINSINKEEYFFEYDEYSKMLKNRQNEDIKLIYLDRLTKNKEINVKENIFSKQYKQMLDAPYLKNDKNVIDWDEKRGLFSGLENDLYYKNKDNIEKIYSFQKEIISIKVLDLYSSIGLENYEAAIVDNDSKKFVRRLCDNVDVLNMYWLNETLSTMSKKYVYNNDVRIKKSLINLIKNNTSSCYLKWTNDGRYLIITSLDKVKIWDSRKNSIQHEIENEDIVSSLDISHKDNIIISHFSRGDNLSIYDLRKREMLKKMSFDGNIYQASWVDDDIIMSKFNKDPFFSYIHNFKEIDSVKIPEYDYFKFCIKPDHSQILNGSSQERILIWDFNKKIKKECILKMEEKFLNLR